MYFVFVIVNINIRKSLINQIRLFSVLQIVVLKYVQNVEFSLRFSHNL